VENVSTDPVPAGGFVQQPLDAVLLLVAPLVEPSLPLGTAAVFDAEPLLDALFADADARQHTLDEIANGDAARLFLCKELPALMEVTQKLTGAMPRQKIIDGSSH
jgi:hypothetical protein